MEDFIKKHRLVFTELLFAVCSVLVFIPLLRVNVGLWSSDMVFHWERFIELTEDVRHLTLPQFDMFTNFHSVATMTFYPWLTMLILVPLKLIGMPPLAIIDTLMVFGLFAGLNTAYFASLSYCRDKMKSLCFAVFYGVSPIITTLYVPQGELAEFGSYLFAPLVLFGWLKIVHGRRSRMFTIGLALMTYTHLLSALFVLIAVLVLTPFMKKPRAKSTYKGLAKRLAQFALITAPEWLPIVVLMALNPITTPAFRGTMAKYAFTVPTSRAHFLWSLDVMWGAVEVITLIWSLIRWKRLTKNQKCLYFLAVAVFVFNLRWLPWGLIDQTIIGHIQFPFRLGAVSHLALAWLLADYVAKGLKDNDMLKHTVAMVLVLVTMFSVVAVNWSLQSSNIRAFKGYHVSMDDPLGYRDAHKGPQAVVGNTLNAIIQYSPVKLTNADYASHKFVQTVANWDYTQRNYTQWLVGHGHGQYEGRQPMPIKADIVDHGFTVDRKHSAKNVMTPVLAYSGQRYRVYRNGKPTSFKAYDGGIVIPNMPKGKSRYTVGTPVMWYRYVAFMLSIIGMLWLVIPYRRDKRS